MKNTLLILMILAYCCGCKKSVNIEPSGIFSGKVIIKTNIVKDNNDTSNLYLENNIELDFDKKTMKAGDCENSLQIVDNMTIVIGKAIVTCPNTADCSCFFSNDTATYIINNDIMNISFKTLKTERQYNFNERDISTIQRSMELRKK